MGKVVELDRIDLVVLFSIVHAYLDEVESFHRMGKTYPDARRAVRTFGIVKVWGGETHFMLNKDTREPIMWLDGPNGQPGPIPDGVVNQRIIRHGFGRPLFHSNQFYRIADKLAQAGWLLGGKTRFTPSLAAEQYVLRVLDKKPPEEWPYRIEVQNGIVTATASSVV